MMLLYLSAILRYSLLGYLDAPIIVMGVQQAPEFHKLRPKSYSYM